MPPKGKSSASAGTRKKHAKKAAAKDGEQDTAPKQQPKKLQRGQKKLSKAQQRALPKVKQYIPPPKPPAPPILDPLDGQGLAKILPAELVVVLRRLGKKDDVTRRKGLDDLREWVFDVKREEDEVERDIKEGVLGSSMPVWMHNLASLLQSPFHRSATLQLHADLLDIPSTRTVILDTLTHSLLPGTQNRDVLGSWLVAALEEGRRNGGVGLASWGTATGWDSEDRINLTDQTSTLIDFLSLAILDPASLHDDINPAPVSSVPSLPPPKGKQKAATPALAPDTDPEATGERWARYRTGGLVGLEWLLRQNRPSEDLTKLVHNSALWSCLSSSSSDGPGFGIGQPPVRRAAYAVLRALLETQPEDLGKEDMLETLSSEMLDSIWLDSEGVVWETAGPVVAKILTKHRELWTRSLSEDDDEPEGEDDSDNDDDSPSSLAFDRFLDFVSTICPIIPQHTYPLLIIILSTLPERLLGLSDPSIRLETLFSHLWSPVDAKLLSTHSLPGQPSVFQAFIRDMVDCTSYLISRALKEGETETASWLASQLGDMVWKEAVLQVGGRAGGRIGPKPEYEATIFGQALARLPSDLAEELLETVSQTILAGCQKSNEVLERAPKIITALRGVANPSAQIRLDRLTADLAGFCADRLDSADAPVFARTFIEAIGCATDATKEKAIRKLSSPDIYGVLPAQQLATLLDALAGAGYRSSVSSIAGSQIRSSSQQLRFDITRHVAPSGLLDTEIIDFVAEEAVQAALIDPKHTAVVTVCIASNISSDVLHTVLALVCTEIHDVTQGILNDDKTKAVPVAAIDILAVYGERHLDDIINSDVFCPALISLHHLVVLLPRITDSYGLPETARSLWARASPSLGEKVVQDLAHLVQDISCRVEPSILVDVALLQCLPAELPSRLLPQAEELKRLVSEYTARSAHPSLAIIDPLISSNDAEVVTLDGADFDAHGRSKAARLAEAALSLIRSNRHLVSNSALMETLLAARALAQDAIAVPGASRGFVEAATPIQVLEQLVKEAEGSLSFAITDYDEVTPAWHQAAIATMRSGQGDALQILLANLAGAIGSPKDDVAARTLRDILIRHLRQCGAGEKEGALWLGFAMQKAENNPTLAMAILLAVKPIMLDTTALATAQNRLASSLAGVPPSQANVKGIPALRLLVASAPPPDAASIFIPQQRAMFVLRHLTAWLTSDEADDFVDDIEFRIAELYTVLAPVVQDLPGSHWDGIFDLIETGLDSASLEDPASICLTYQCLALLRQVRDLCESNKSLRTAWTGKATHMSLVFKLFLQCRDAVTLPSRMVHSLLLDLLRDASNVGDDAPGLVTMLSSNSAAVQTTAYRLLNQTIKRQTLALVLEVESSVQGQERDIKLPRELLDLPESAATISDWHSEVSVSTILGQLLAWMAILDHFDDASRTIRWAYLDHLNTSGLLSNTLLPMLFAILGVSEIGAWNFGASSFAVDEFYPDLLEPEELADLTPLASHVFYRTLITLPSAIRAYYEGLKDRQLSMSMLNFTARHYSPVIIQHEFAALREPSQMAQLTEEGLNIKIASGGGATVAGGGSAEAIASYVVDEQPMEIGIRLPAEFPLKGVDVRDLRRVGVPENKWRGWLMSVQQTITSRNGLILDALTVFKKNVSLHFEGVVECAICYSIISLSDRTLPTKPCRTCKNRFHASCLYKWFNSSHSSSCPLCRALF